MWPLAPQNYNSGNSWPCQDAAYPICTGFAQGVAWGHCRSECGRRRTQEAASATICWVADKMDGMIILGGPGLCERALNTNGVNVNGPVTITNPPISLPADYQPEELISFGAGDVGIELGTCTRGVIVHLAMGPTGSVHGDAG